MYNEYLIFLDTYTTTDFGSYKEMQEKYPTAYRIVKMS